VSLPFLYCFDSGIKKARSLDVREGRIWGRIRKRYANMWTLRGTSNIRINNVIIARRTEWGEKT